MERPNQSVIRGRAATAETFELPEGALLELDRIHGQLRVRDSEGREAVFPSHPAARSLLEPLLEARELRFGLGRGALLFASRRGEALHHVSVDPPRSVSHCLSDRVRGSEQMSLYSVELGFLVITERGLTLIDLAGRMLWRIDDLTYDWCFEGEADGALWCSDVHGNVLGFDAQSGRAL